MSVFGPPPRQDGDGTRWYGLYPAVVDDIVDPQAKGRISVSFPSLGTAGEQVRAWATLLTPYADDDQGLMVLPEVGSQVVVAFEAGDPARPYIVGACWNGQRALPEPAQAANNLRTLKTRSGCVLQFDDTAGAVKITLSTPGGHELVLDDGTMSVAVTNSNGCKLEMNVAGQVTVDANLSCDISAAVINLKAPIVNCDGIVKCQTLIASAGVVSPSYTPGAGNVW